MLARSNTNEGDFFFRVKVFDDLLSLSGELSDEGTIIDGLVLAHSGTDGNTLGIHDDHAQDTHMGLDSIYSLFYFLWHFELSLI